MNHQERQAFTAQLSALLRSGTPLVQSLQMIRSTQTTKEVNWLDIAIQKMEQGQPFSEALRQSKENFDAFYCGLIELGQETGRLDSVLVKLSADLEATSRINSKIKRALIYPSAIITIAMAIVVGMLQWVIPTFESVFASFNASLPLPTQIVLNVSKFVQNYFLSALVITLILTACLIFTWNFSIRFQKGLDRFLLSIPLCKKLLRHSLLARWATTIHTLQAAGVPLLESIRIYSRCSNHWTMHDLNAAVHQSLSRGYPIHSSVELADTRLNVFDRLSIQLLKVGEDSGSLLEMLDYLGRHHEKMLDNSIDIMMQLLEPVLVCFLGLMIGGMVIALYLPLFQLGQLT